MKRIFKRKRGVSLAFLCLLLFLTACSSKSADSGQAETGGTTAAAKKVINVGIVTSPSAFNPINTPNNITAIVTSIMFLPLVEQDDEMKFQPMLADSIETSDNQVFTVKLNAAAKWSDGQPVTAKDVLFTIKMIADPKINASVASNLNVLEGFDDTGKVQGSFEGVTGVKLVDDHTLEFRTKNKMDLDLFKSKVGTNVKTLPEHVLKDAAVDTWDQNEFFQKPDVTSGAFKFVSYAKDQYIQFEANKDYFKGAPKIDELNLKIMPSANLVAQLQSGEIDMNLPGVGAIDVGDYERVKNMSNLRTVEGIPVSYQTIIFNMQSLTDVKVRQAIAYAINRQLIVENLLKGQAEIVDGPYTSQQPYFNKELVPYAYDPTKAKELLKEAGWDSSKKLTFVVPTGNKTREQAADIIVQNLKAVGIETQIQKYDVATSVQKVQDKQFDIDLLGQAITIDPDLTTTLSEKGSFNLSGYKDAEMEQLLASGNKEMDPAKKLEIYNKIQEKFKAELPQLTLYSDKQLRAINKRVTVGEPKNFGTFIDVYKWDVAE